MASHSGAPYDATLEADFLLVACLDGVSSWCALVVHGDNGDLGRMWAWKGIHEGSKSNCEGLTGNHDKHLNPSLSAPRALCHVLADQAQVCDCFA